MLTEQIPFYAVRHSVKPGLTGWAQVRYSYGATVEQSVRKLEYDLYYVKNHTLFLDLSSCSRRSASSCSARGRASAGVASAFPRSGGCGRLASPRRGIRALRAASASARAFGRHAGPAMPVTAPRLDADAVTDRRSPSPSWSYGLAAVGLLAFALRMALGWRAAARLRCCSRRRSSRPSCGRGACILAVARADRADVSCCVNVADALRYALWFAFIATLLRGPEAELATRSPARWPMVSRLRRCWPASCCPKGCRSRRARHAPARGEYALRLGLAIVRAGARRAALPPRAPAGALGDQAAVPCAGRRSSASTCSSSPTRCCSAASTPTSGSRAASPTRWSIPFIAIATARKRGWTIEMHLSRGAVFHSTALVVSGAVSAGGRRRGLHRPLFRRRLGPRAADRAVVRRRCCSAAGRDVGTLRARLQGVRQQALLLLSLRLSRGVAAVHAHAFDRRGALQRAGERTIKALADLVESPARSALAAGRARGRFVPAARWNMPADRRGRSRATRSLPRFLSARLGRRPRGVPPPTRALSASSCIPRWLRTVPNAWLVVPLIAGHEADRFRRAAEPRAPRSTSNWEVRDLLKTASARRRRATCGQMQRDRGAARGAQVRRLQPDVGLRRPRSEEHGRAAFADAQERRTAPRQSRVPARHADDRRARRRPHERS